MLKKENEKIIRLHKQGKLYSEISLELGIPLVEVVQVIESKNRKSKKTFKEERRDKIMRLHQEGKTIAEISNELKINEIMIREELLMLGIPGVMPKVQGREENKRIRHLKEIGKVQERVNTRTLRIEKRREKVVELYNQGKSQKEISEELDVSKPTIHLDIKCLKETGKIQERVNTRTLEIETRREKVVELYNQRKSPKEIAKELDVSRSVISKDIKHLKKIGKIQERVNTRTLKKEKRKEKVVELYNQGKSPKEIAEELNVSINIIYKDIKHLKEIGKIQERKNLEKEKRREKVVKLYNQGKSPKEIAEELDVSQQTIYKDIKRLKEIGKIQGRKKLEKEKRREKVVELYNQGKSPKEITEELNVSAATISKDIKHLKEIGKIQESVIETRRKKVVELYNQGKSQREIAEELDVSQQTIYNDIKHLRETGKIQGRKNLEIGNIHKRIIKEKIRKFLELRDYDKIRELIAIYIDNKYLSDEFMQKLIEFGNMIEKNQTDNMKSNETEHMEEER